MKKFVLTYLVFLFSSNSFAADCAISASGDYIMKNWTGQCKNGMVHGEGAGTNYTKAYTIGKYEVYEYGTDKTGFIFEDWGWEKTIEVYKIDKFTKDPYGRNQRVYDYKCVEGCTPYITKKSIWIAEGSPNTAGNRVPLEILLSAQYEQIQKRGIDSMDPSTFKSYLLAEENKIAVAEIKKIDMIEDPLVAGVTLSLGSANKPNKKSKKK